MNINESKLQDYYPIYKELHDKCKDLRFRLWDPQYDNAVEERNTLQKQMISLLCDELDRAKILRIYDKEPLGETMWYKVYSDCYSILNLYLIVDGIKCCICYTIEDLNMFVDGRTYSHHDDKGGIYKMWLDMLPKTVSSFLTSH